MSWRDVGSTYLLLGALAAIVVLGDRAPRPLESTPAAGAPERSLLGSAADAVDAVAFRRAGLVVHATRDGERWRVLTPSRAQIPSDLVAAAVATLTAGQVSEVVAESPGIELASFGLVEPTAEIEVTIRGESPSAVRVRLGANNPTGTALYAKRDDRSTVFLVGLNLRYYTDLIFQAAVAPEP